MKYTGLNLHPDSTTAERTQWYVRVRWFFLLAVAIPGVFSNFIGEGLSAQVQRDITLGVIALASNALFFVLAMQKQHDRYQRQLAVTMLLVDILTITILIFTKGGIESRSPILYTIPLLVSSALFGQRGVYFTAALSILLYNLLIVADYTHIIHSIGAVNPGLRLNGTYVLNTVTFFTSVLAIIALLADFITRLLKEQQGIAKTNQHELEEAQRLAKIGSWNWDVKSNHIEWSNQMHTMFGVKKQHFDGRFENYIQFIYPDDRKLVEETVGRSLKTGEPFTFEHRIKIDGKIIWLHAEGQVKLKDGKPIRMFGTAQDITTIKSVDQKLVASNRELEDINQLMVGRELKMIELKRENEDLRKKLS